jgi:hypothetical protein
MLQHILTCKVFWECYIMPGLMGFQTLLIIQCTEEYISETGCFCPRVEK